MIVRIMTLMTYRKEGRSTLVNDEKYIGRAAHLSW